MPLEYTIERHPEQFGEIRIEAKPNEWATEARATVVVADRFPKEKPVPRVEHISWSVGARNWTIDDARTFFNAMLKMLDVAESELKTAEEKAKTEVLQGQAGKPKKGKK